MVKYLIKTWADFANGAAVDIYKNMAYMGTIVNSGRASAMVVATGMATEMGRIATALQEVKAEKTPLQKSINTLGRYIIFLVLGVPVRCWLR